MKKIDFVILWVDGNDPKWRKEKEKYSDNLQTVYSKMAKSEKCFRDWDLLRFWFRGVEKFAPWVNKIHFVTWGHLPLWLNILNPKLNVVNHKDFIPEEYLPLFNSRAIEININRIKGISDQFVYFNDDQFLINNVSPSDFFVNGLPCDCAIMSPVKPERGGTATAQINDMEIVNDHFGGFESLIKNKDKWFTMKYGKSIIKTLLVLPWKTIFGYFEPHLPASYLKATFDEVWEKEFNDLQETLNSRFRRKSDVNQWLMRYWQLSSGNFYPRNPNIGKFYGVADHANEICDLIRKQSKKIICINDSSDIADIDNIQSRVQQAFLTILPNKSCFEL